jgi:4-amino-4-deoxy-L-arabinose transferase-like glycosyltransferase
VKDLVGLFALLAIAATVRLITPIEWTLDNANADSDVYLAMAMMVFRGFTLYNEIFCGHPPLMIWILVLAFRAFGVSAVVGGIIGVGLSLIGISGVFFVAKRLSGFSAGIISVILLSFSPLYLQVSRSASNEILLCALTPWMLYSFLLHLESKSFRWLILSGLLSGLAFLSKFYAVFLFLPICLYFVYKRSYREVAYYLILTVAPMLTLLTFDLNAVWRDVFLFPLYRPVMSFDLRLEIIIGFLRENLGLILLGFAGAFFQLRVHKNERTNFLILWLLITFLGLTFQATLFKHHLVHTLIPLTVCTSFLIQELPRLKPKKATAFILLLLAVTVPITATYDPVGITPRFPDLVRVRFEVAYIVQNLTGPNDFVVSGDLMIPVIANRMVPPNLIDISSTRYGAKFLSSRDLIEACINYNVKVVIISTRLLSFVKFINFVHKYYIGLGTFRSSTYSQYYAYTIYVKR